MIDGVYFADTVCVVALGIDTTGVKHPLGVVAGSAENTTTVTGLLTRATGAGPEHDSAGVWRSWTAPPHLVHRIARGELEGRGSELGLADPVLDIGLFPIESVVRGSAGSARR